MVGLQEHEPPDPTCVYCDAPAAGRCAACHALVCANCAEVSQGAARPVVFCTACHEGGAGRMHWRALWRAVWPIVAIAALGAALLALRVWVG